MHGSNAQTKRQLLKFVAAAAVVDLLPGCGGDGSSSPGGGVAPVAAAITAQPTDQSVSAGATATFSVTATGTPAPTYQWQSSTDAGATYAAVAGATAASHTTAATTGADTGTRFRVVVTNTLASVTSTAATLTVAVAGGAGVALSAFAGNVYGPGADGTGAGGTFDYPTGPAVDSAGNVYVADSMNDTIRKITPAGVVTTLSGTYFEEGDADGSGAAVGFFSPRGVAVGADGTVYVCDTGNNKIRKITTAGVVTTLAGSATDQPGHADGTGAAASFFGPNTLAIDAAGNLFVADTGNDTIRKITPAGAVTTFAGSAGQAGSADGTGSTARFDNAQGLAIDSAGTVYVGDYANHTIRTITAAGVVSTLTGSAGVQGGTDGPLASATFEYPMAVAVDATGIVYVADGLTGRIRKITPAGIVSTLVAIAGANAPPDFTVNGLAVDGAGNLIATNGAADKVLTVTPAGVVTTLAGSPGSNGGRLNGTGTAAAFFFPAAVTADSAGNVYVADSANDTIRKITPAGVTTTLAGAPPTSDVLYFLPGVIAKLGNSQLASYDSGTGSNDGTGSGAAFSYPLGLTCDGAGTLYVADANNSTIRQVTPGGVVTTLAGAAGIWGTVDGTGSAARFAAPTGLAIDSAGTLYVTDYNDHVVRKIASGGVVTTIAGTAGTAGAADGSGTAATFAYPTGIAVDSAGNLYVVDTGNCLIRKITPVGVVTTLAGMAGASGSADGAGSAARFDAPTGIVLGASGNLYVSDTRNHTIRSVTPAGVVSTVVGVAGAGTFVAGALPGGLREPVGMVMSGGTLYVATMCGVAAIAGLA